MSFNISNKLVFIDSFLFPSSSLYRSVENLAKDYFKYLSQAFDCKVLGLVKWKGFFAYEYMTFFEKFKEDLPNKESVL